MQITRALKTSWVIVAVLWSALAQQISNASEYSIGPGDVLKVLVYEHPDLTTVARTSESGSITFPLLGEVSIAGLSSRAVEGRLEELLRQGGFVKRPQVSLSIEEYASQWASVLGQVNRAGTYPIQARKTVIDLIAAAGGLSANAADTVTVIRRSGDIDNKLELDLFAMFISGDLTQDVEVSNGDIIFVPRMPVFYIYGEVQQPGSYRLEKGMTVMQALSVGGGLTARGTEQGVRVKRRNASNTIETLEIKLSDQLQANDVIYVKESLF